ncbi:hypothetical protein B0H21DRAFT_52231 [Amylocystis lapponica]|nr:hypothetical protein B0H21DRAFT_52231 [Amylocystis lapponica]
MDATAPSRVPTVPVNDMAFKTWQAFMFYATFGKVEFAPLLSQGPTTRKEQVTWQTELPRPPRCSPKSMYRLADKYDILELKRLAKAGIEERLSEYNILQELFSPFTSWSVGKPDWDWIADRLFVMIQVPGNTRA